MRNILSNKSSTDKQGRKPSKGNVDGDSGTGVSLTQQAYERIRADVLSCRLAPGERLNIADLAKRLPASLGAVREALSRLTSEGLVEAEPQRGFRVTPLSDEDLRDLTMLRIEIEKLCLQHSIEKGDVRWESALVGAYHHLSRVPLTISSDSQQMNPEWIAAHEAFHEALASACQSPWLLRVRRMLYAQSERYRQLSVPLAQGPRDQDREHRTIMKAAIDRDTAKATAAMESHLQQTTAILLRASERRGQQAKDA